LLCAALCKELRPSLAVRRPCGFGDLPLLAAQLHDAFGARGRSNDGEAKPIKAAQPNAANELRI
jgi:hypothetical protein